MISVVIPTHESEHQLVHTLAALVPGALAGVVREVIVTDAGSQDETATVADVAGCRFMVQPGGARGARLAAAGAGTPPVPFASLSWPDAVDRLAAPVERAVRDSGPRAADGRIARRMAGEDGAAEVLRQAESLVAARRPAAT